MNYPLKLLDSTFADGLTQNCVGGSGRRSGDMGLDDDRATTANVISVGEAVRHVCRIEKILTGTVRHSNYGQFETGERHG